MRIVGKKLILWGVITPLWGMLPSPAKASVLSNGNLVLTVNDGNGVIQSVKLTGVEFYQLGTPVSDYGLQVNTDSSSFRLNSNAFGSSQSVAVSSTASTITVNGTYTAGGANVSFTRQYTLVAGDNVIRTTTTFTNNAAS